MLANILDARPSRRREDSSSPARTRDADDRREVDQRHDGSISRLVRRRADRRLSVASFQLDARRVADLRRERRHDLRGTRDHVAKDAASRSGTSSVGMLAKFETVGSRARRDDAVERQRPQALPGLRLAVEERDPSVRQHHEARDSLVADACEKNRPVAKKFGEDVQDPLYKTLQGISTRPPRRRRDPPPLYATKETAH